VQYENKNVTEMGPLKKKMILSHLAEHNVNLKEIDAVIGRGGLVKPMAGGAYYVNDSMLKDLRQGLQGMHASNLGGILAHHIAVEAGCISLISDGVVVDELSTLARYTGMPDIPRVSIFHALNQKRVSFLTAEKIGKPYNKCRFVVLHGGGGVSVGAHINGKVADVNNGLDGEGPMTPQRTGTLPTGPLIKLCYGGKFSLPEMYLKVKGRGGVYSYTGTHDLKELSHFIDTGAKPPESTIYCTREEAKEVRDAMIYQFVKYIGYMAAAAEGNLDAIILTGGLMSNPYIRETLKPKIAWLAKEVYVYPGSDEKAALREAAVRALDNPQTIKEYK
jgi:butyrate kinase